MTHYIQDACPYYKITTGAIIPCLRKLCTEKCALLDEGSKDMSNTGTAVQTTLDLNAAGDIKAKVAGPATIPVSPATSAAAAKASYNYKPNCHSGMYRVGAIHGMTLWAGRRAAVDPWRGPIYGAHKNYAAVISLLGSNTGFKPPVQANQAARQLFGDDVLGCGDVPLVYIDWPDFGAMDELDREWWIRFAAKLATVQGDVGIFCEGGHGRTGTAVSILAVLYGWVPAAACPVEWLRGKYCKEVVESAEQIKYIETITGTQCLAEPRMGGWGSFGGNGSSTTHGHHGTTTAPAKATAHVDKGHTLSKKKLKVWLRAGIPDYSVKVGDMMRWFENCDIIRVEGDYFEYHAASRQFLKIIAPSSNDKVWAMASSEELRKRHEDSQKVLGKNTVSGWPIRPVESASCKLSVNDLIDLWADITAEYAGLHPHIKETGWTKDDIAICDAMFAKESA